MVIVLNSIINRTRIDTKKSCEFEKKNIEIKWECKDFFEETFANKRFQSDLE